MVINIVLKFGKAIYDFFCSPEYSLDLSLLGLWLKVLPEAPFQTK